jgi:hypothetical protein
MFGLPEISCGDTRPHDWHTDGTVWCPGLPAMSAAATLPTFAELDRMARAAGVIGGTYPDPDGSAWDPRRAYAMINGQLYTAPAVREPFAGQWPNPGGNESTHSRDRDGDYAAAMDENRTERQR